LATGLVSITVSPVNDAPIAFSLSLTNAEDAALPITLTSFDVDGPVTNVTVLSSPTNGTLTGTAPNVVYQPATNYNGPDSFTFTVNDGSLTSAVATVSITVTPVNDAPIAGDQSITTPEDTATNLFLAATDVDSTNLAFAVLSPPTNGVITGFDTNTGAFTYTPHMDYNGPDFLSFTVSDGSLLATGLVSITVSPVNDAPVAFSLSLTNAEDTALPITLTSFDVDGPVTNFTVLTSPTNGTLTGTAPNLVYQPATNYNGLDSFTFMVNDGALTSAVAAVTITVTPVNDAPIANADFVTTAEDTPVTFNPLLNDTEVEGDTLTIIGAIATNGTVVILDATNLFFTPTTNFTGLASIVYTNSDGHGGSAFTTVTVTVTPVNDPPVANDDSVTTSEDTPVILNPLLNDTDADGDALTIIGAIATNGTVVIVDQTNLVFTPDTNFNGIASINYTNADGHGGTAFATVTVTVTPVNDPPIANDDSISTPEDTPVTFNPLLNDADTDGDALTILGASATNGTVAILNQTNLLFTPATNFNGTASIIYTNNDGHGGSAVARVTVTVTPVNDAPIARDDSVVMQHNTPVTIHPLLNDSDVDGDALTLVAAVTTSGTVAILDQTNLVFAPEVNFSGLVFITYTNSDGNGGTAFATITVLVNDPPVAVDDSVSTAEDAPVTFNPLINDSDVDGDTLTIISATATNGTVAILNQTNLLFTPATNFNGVTSIIYRNHDGHGETAVATVTVTVTPVNDAPIARDDTAATRRNTPVTIRPLLNDSDVDGDALTLLTATATNGAVAILDQTNLVFTPDTNFSGLAFITYTNSDGNGGTAFATITVLVNDPPVATDDSVSTAEDTPLTFNPLLNDSDADGDALTILGATATNGTVTILNQTNLLFTPATNFNGTASIIYTNSDGYGETAFATVTITVTPASDPPVAMPDAADTCVNVSLVLPCAVLLANDRDPDTGGVLTVTNVSPVSSGGGSVSLADGSVSYVPFTNFTGLDSFTYTVRNVAGDQATGTVVVKVWPTLNILTIAAQTNGNMLIRFCGLHGTNYEMEASTNFAGWNNLGPLTEGVPGVFQFEDTNTAGLDKRFYRVLSP
ncbi:MAG: tandem-95 repeat protein, partial [Verrucomicrobia bacterium]